MQNDHPYHVFEYVNRQYVCKCGAVDSPDWPCAERDGLVEDKAAHRPTEGEL